MIKCNSNLTISSRLFFSNIYIQYAIVKYRFLLHIYLRICYRFRIYKSLNIYVQYIFEPEQLNLINSAF